jgi:hypothetical protein
VRCQLAADVQHAGDELDFGPRDAAGLRHAKPRVDEEAAEHVVPPRSTSRLDALVRRLPELGEKERRVLGSERSRLGLRALRRQPIARDASERICGHVVALASESEDGPKRDEYTVGRPL